MTPTRKAIPFAVVNLIHCRRVRRRDLSAKDRPPDEYYLLFDDFGGKHLIQWNQQFFTLFRVKKQNNRPFL
ncbi:MAG: hypothetical protein LBK82_06470 [Planctomycetaceae bacterium]|nr:hypothetical protein [Planctomycetaceae bacterium]